MWLRAERQTAGRGRQGRPWTSPEGNLYASTLLHVGSTGDPPAATLALAAAVALAKVAAALGADVRIKWPNDLLLDGAKIAGILLERSGDWVVMGFGVNIASAPDVPGRATARLADHVAQPLTPDRLLTLLAEAVAEQVAVWRHHGLASIITAWLERSHPPGTALSVNLPDGSATQGRFDGLTSDGAMILRLADGTGRVIHAGDVFLI